MGCRQNHSAGWQRNPRRRGSGPDSAGQLAPNRVETKPELPVARIWPRAGPEGRFLVARHGSGHPNWWPCPDRGGLDSCGRARFFSGGGLGCCSSDCLVDFHAATLGRDGLNRDRLLHPDGGTQSGWSNRRFQEGPNDRPQSNCPGERLLDRNADSAELSNCQGLRGGVSRHSGAG